MVVSFTDRQSKVASIKKASPAVRKRPYPWALWKGVARKNIQAEDRVLLVNTGAGQKYPEVVPESLLRIDITKPVDWSGI